MYDVFLMLQRFLKRVYVYSTNQTKAENLESISKNKVFKIENFPNPWLISQIPTLLTPLSFPHWAICNPPLDKLVSGLHVGTSLDVRPAAFSSVRLAWARVTSAFEMGIHIYRIIWVYHLSWWCKWATVRSF